DAYSLTVQVRSASGILVPDAAVRLGGLDTAKVKIAEAGGPLGQTGAPGSANYGAHTWTLYSATAGTFTATVQVLTAGNQWADIGPVPAQLRFNADAPAAVNSWLVQPDGSAPADGAAPLEVKARVRDVNGNNVGAGQVVFAVPAGLTATVGGQSTVGGPAVTVAAPIAGGYATVDFTSTRAGVHQVGAKVVGKDISTVKNALETTTLATSGLAKLTFTAGPAASDKSQLTVPTAAGGATKVADGQERHRAEVQARDAFGNPAPGTVVMFRHGPDDAHLTEDTVAADAAGLAAVEFASTAVADFIVRAYIGGHPVAGSPQRARFVAGPLDLAKTLASFEVQDTTALATGLHPLWARLKAQDASGNPIAGVELGFKLTAAGPGPVFEPLASGLKSVSGRSGPDGHLTAQIVSEFDGVFPVVGLVGSDQTAPQNVTFAADSAAPDKSWFTVARDPANQGDPATADGADSYRVVVHLRGALNRPLNSVKAVVKVADPAAGTVTEHAVTTGPASGQSGAAVFDLTSTKAGTFDVTVELGGDRLSLGAPGAGDKVARALFKPGPPAAANSRLIGPDSGPAKADGLEQQVVRALVMDAQSNPAAGAEVVFAIPAHVTAISPAAPGSPGPGPAVSGPADVVVAADAAGQARLVLVSQVTGAYPITASLRAGAGADPITDGSPAQAVFTNADLSPGRSVFTIPTAPAPKTVRTEFHHPTVELFDASGNLYTAAPVPVTFRWRLKGASAWAGSKTVNSTAGVAVWPDWTESTAGDYEVEAAAPSGQVGATLTARFVAGPAVPAASTFTSSAGTAVLNDGQASHFAEVAVKDAAVGGNPVAGQPVTFTVDGSAAIVGAASPGRTLTVNSSAAGLARVRIVDARRGGETVKVTASVGGVEVGSADLEFAPAAPDAARSSWAVAPTTPISAGHPAVVADGADSWQGVVTLRDASGRPVADSDVFFDVPGDVSISQPGPHQTDAAGVLTVTFSSTRAGAYQVRATVGSQAIPPGPATIRFAAGPIAASASRLEAPGVTAPADGQSKLTVRAHVLDAHGNPPAGAEVRFSLPPGLTAAGLSSPGGHLDVPVDPATGLADLDVTATAAGVYDVTAAARLGGTAAWTPIAKDSPAEVQFVAGPVSPARSELSRSPSGPLQVGAPGATYLVRARLLDQRGNSVEQADVPIQFRFFLGGDPSDPAAFCSQAPSATTQFASAVTDSTGLATAPFTSTEAGDWHGCAYYAGAQIVGGSPVDLAFVAGPADLARSSFEVSQNLVLADGRAAHYGQVTVRDAFGNPLGGKLVTLAIGQGSPNVPGPNVKGETAPQATVKTCDADDQAGAPSWCRAGGVFQPGLARVEFTSLEPGTFPVSARLGSAALDASPKAVSFTSGPAAPGQSSWEIDPNTADPVSGGSVSVPATGLSADAYQLTVTARSTADLLVPGARVRLAGLNPAVQVDGGAEGATGAAGSADYGRHVWRLRSAVAGQFTGRVQVFQGGGWADVDGPFTVRFRSGAAAADRSWLTQPPGPALADGAAALPVTAQVRDALGDPVDGAEVVFQVPAGATAVCGAGAGGAGGGAGVRGPGRVTAVTKDGAATCWFTSPQVGPKTITAALKGSPDQPLLTVRDASGGALRNDGKVALDFTGGLPSGPNSELTIPTAGTPKPVGGVGKHVAEVVVRDAEGRPLPGVPVRFQWTAGTRQGPGDGPWTTVEAGLSDSSGRAEVEFAAPGNKAGWVWVKAFAGYAGQPEPVGPAQSQPAAQQSLRGALFVAGPVDPARTAASFETFPAAVLNDLSQRSWARVVVQDRYGNGVPGAKVVFTLPAGGPGGAGTPVFASGSAPGAKTVTVVSCAADLSPVPERCRRDGVYTPGLAFAPIISAAAGVFPVSGRVEPSGAATFAVGPGDVTFAADAGRASASSFTLTPSQPGAAPPAADGAAGYDLTVTVMGGPGAKPVAGQCVTPQLPPGVTALAGPAGHCPRGSFETGADGRASIKIVSTRAGWAGIGVSLGGSPIPTEAGGSSFARAALFVGGPPSGARSELTSPPAPGRVGDPAGQTVTATLRDANGNLASCWRGGVQEPCPVALSVPAGTTASAGGGGAGGGSGVVVGPGAIALAAQPVDYGPEPAPGSAAAGSFAPPLGGGSASATYHSLTPGAHDVTGSVDGQDLGIADGVASTAGPAKARIVFLPAKGPGPGPPPPP
ncbi:MAG: Ig-like domain-containing protein, partial [Bifidobacteriaceae bacterium]|nr:Ig-like domain-containing protein [Bifidobacteriaceae bacterium]